jgi:Fe-Mn family superoxide dismutase
MSVAQIVISTAPHESQTLAFNYASLALNNSFFLHHLVSSLSNEKKTKKQCFNDTTR